MKCHCETTTHSNHKWCLPWVQLGPQSFTAFMYLQRRGNISPKKWRRSGISRASVQIGLTYLKAFKRGLLLSRHPLLSMLQGVLLTQKLAQLWSLAHPEILPFLSKFFSFSKAQVPYLFLSKAFYENLKSKSCHFSLLSFDHPWPA